MHSLGELAVRFGLELHGDPELSVAGVATLAQATEGTLSFYANSRYQKHLASTQATAVVLSPGDLALCPVAALVDPNPYLAYARIVTLMQPAEPVAAAIHPSAVVAATAQVAASASVGALCVIEAGAVIGERCRIGAGCTILAGARIGDGHAIDAAGHAVSGGEDRRALPAAFRRGDRRRRLRFRAG